MAVSRVEIRRYDLVFPWPALVLGQTAPGLQAFQFDGHPIFLPIDRGARSILGTSSLSFRDPPHVVRIGPNKALEAGHVDLDITGRNIPIKHVTDSLESKDAFARDLDPQIGCMFLNQDLSTFIVFTNRLDHRIRDLAPRITGPTNRLSPA